MPTRDKFRTGTKIRLVHDEIRALAFAKGPNYKLPTARELCAQFQINSDSLNETLRNLEAANVITRRQGSGIYVSPKIGHKSIAIVFSQKSNGQFIGSPFWGMLQELLFGSALERVPVKEHEYSFHLIPFGVSREDSVSRTNFENLLFAGNLNGVLSVQSDEPLQGLLFDSGLPVVGYALGPRFGYGVGFDQLEMFRLAADQLTRQGCKRIMLMPSPNVRDLLYLQILELCREMNPPVMFADKTRYPAVFYGGAKHQDVGWQMAMEIFHSQDGPRPDGLIVLDDMIADGIIKALGTIGICPGRDVRIATHANAGSPILHCWENQLTLIECDPAMIVEKMFETLDAILDARVQDRGYMHLPWRVRVHGSVIPPVEFG